MKWKFSFNVIWKEGETDYYQEGVIEHSEKLNTEDEVRLYLCKQVNPDPFTDYPKIFNIQVAQCKQNT